MSGFNIADNYDPSIWIPGIREKAEVLPNLINSGILSRSPLFDTIASGPSSIADIPFFRSIANQDEAIQVERVAPTVQGQTTSKQVCVMLNRETANDLTAMSANLGALDPVGDLLGQIAERRTIQEQKRLLFTLRGVFGVAAVSSALSVDHFHEATADIVAADAITGAYVLDAVAKLGDFGTTNGIIVCHPNIRVALIKLDDKQYFLDREGPVIIEYYKQMRLFTSELLVRAGTGVGTPNVYETFIILPGTFAKGEKTQVSGDTGNPAIDVASINMIKDGTTNVLTLIDRTRTIFHPSGMKWLDASVAASSPTNAELATAANWGMAASDAKLLGMTRIRTNG